MTRALVIGILIATAAPAFAHKPSDAHLRLDVDGDQLVGRLDVAVRDLDAALSLDDGDSELTWGELDAARPRIAQYIAGRLGFGCATTLGDGALVDLSDGAYWSTPLTVHCAPRTLPITYSLLFDVDAQHRGLVHIGSQTLIVRDAQPVSVELAGGTVLGTFVREGVWHIWIGIDHILFLVCLLLPAVWTSGHRRKSLREVCIEVFEIVTAFTLAHSITLVISAVGLFTLPSRLVETAIALSVVAAALNNIVRVVDARWAVAFALGLLHGFGFSSVLIDLGLPSRELIGALLGFNLGVELGQAAIVVGLLPLLYLIRSTLAYRVLLFAGSGAVAVIASLWTYQRFVT
ncbi:MAG TPA: HupE/UreJ family protein [Kofleriaceae bacterium]